MLLKTKLEALRQRCNSNRERKNSGNKIKKKKHGESERAKESVGETSGRLISSELVGGGNGAMEIVHEIKGDNDRILLAREIDQRNERTKNSTAIIKCLVLSC